MPTAGSSGACRWDIVAVVMRGFAIPRCGSPIDSLRSFCMALQLGLLRAQA
jgi:hypothetical protein